MKKTSLIALLLTASSMSHAYLATENFESYTDDPLDGAGGQTGGTGDWSGEWSDPGNRSYLYTGNAIDFSSGGNKAVGLFGNGLTSSTRNLSNFDQAGQEVTYSFSFETLYDIGGGQEVGMNIGDKEGTVLTVKVDDAGTIQFNDGGSDFDSSGGQTAVNYFEDVTYDVEATFTVGSAAYSLTVTQRSNTGNTITFSDTLDSNTFSGAGFMTIFWNLAGGSGNDAIFDDIQVVPEPGSFALLGGLFALTFVALRRRG